MLLLLHSAMMMFRHFFLHYLDLLVWFGGFMVALGLVWLHARAAGFVLGCTPVSCGLVCRVSALPLGLGYTVVMIHCVILHVHCTIAIYSFPFVILPQCHIILVLHFVFYTFYDTILR